MRGLLVAVGVLVAGLSVVPSPTAPAAALEADAPDRPAVVEVRTIGHSVRGRPIRAWRLGEPGKRPMVLVSTMHGNEPHTRRILETLRDGRAIRGVDLWVVPTYNPDGLARGTRRNAHGVDLNRNFPYKWADLDGNYESGPRPGSEPETRAMMGFLQEVRPRRVLSFHQPLVGVDTDTKDAGFARRVARALRLPRKTLDCGGLCHGTMTMWFNHHFAGSALTVEYGARPPRHRMVVQAPRQVLGVLGAHRTSRG
ncbi:Peptidase M14, carboxypeptidase A [metagenome]|uniref:Peptidase M14, carboxypeptidase A n=1 Tax=metagenome TaxID=256318 RepID=A0A2P2C418_9ZZZZ